MKIKREKLLIALAKKEMKASDIKSISRCTYDRAMKGESLTPATVGRLAKEMEVPVEELIEVSR